MKTYLLTIFALLFSVSQGFVVPKSNSIVSSKPSSFQQQTSTALNERQWNFNNGRGPFGLKKNAEIWNGRAAQMGFTIVLLQELITGKGVIEGIQEGNIFNLAMLGIAGVSIVGLTAFLAVKGKDSDIIIEE